MKYKTLTLFFLLTMLTGLSACGENAAVVATEQAAPPDSDISNRSTTTPSTSFTSQEMGNVPRNLLTYDDLMNDFDSASPVDEAALTLPADAAPPAHIFEGRLELRGEDTAGEMTVLRGNPDVEPEESHLPEFDFEFVQSDGYLIPAQRGLIIADHPYWNYIFEPGRVWQENDDQGYTRASFPFALVWKG
ncbi:MAG: hypothetical protein GY796_26125, partial [Chloroflexi bacterium]|nr:hypothetical protein [Chloroflexota bacterium]